MRIEALDVNASSGILAAALISGKNPAWDEDEDGSAMGVTGRTFPVFKTARTQAATKTGSSRPAGVTKPRTLDLRQIVKLINLGANKLKILNLLRRRDWLKIMRLLPKDLLVNALRLFSKAKLLRMILHLPRKFVLQIMLKLFKIHELVKRMPTSQLMRILRSPKMDNRKLATGILNTMEPRFLQMLMSRIFGGNQDFTKLKPREIFKLLMEVDRCRITESLKTMPFKALQPLVTHFIKKEPELLFYLSEAFVYKQMSQIPKPYLIQACSVLPPEVLMHMLEQLPNPMLLLAAAQIDDKSLEDYLVSQHGDILQMLGEAA
jgi:hypothetical protein